MQLRPDQVTFVSQIREQFRQGRRRVVAQAATGFGKTVCFSYMTQNASAKGNSVIVLAHRSEILDQISKALGQFSVPHGRIQSGYPMTLHHNVQVASVGTLARRLDKIAPPTMVIVDECHHSAASQYVQIFAAWPKSFFLGFTATPERLDGRGLGEFYESMVYAPPVKWLVDQGFLARATYYAPPATVDTSSIRKTAGDFNRGDSEKLIDVPTITGNAVDHYRKLCDGARAIAFCISIEHAKHVAEQFNRSGIPSECIDGTLSDEERAARVANLTSGVTRVMTSCELVSEGFDLPSVEAAILLRPTMSLSMHLQQLGRAGRRKPAPNTCIILDHVGNCIRHGLMDDDRQWSLEGRPKRKASETPIETQQCETCFAIFQGRECPQCGTEREIQKREIEVTDGQLVKLTDEQRQAMTRQRKTEERSCKTYEDFRKLGEMRGYKNPAAWAHFRVKHSRRPDVVRSV